MLWPVSPSHGAAETSAADDAASTTKLLENGSPLRDGFVAVAVPTNAAVDPRPNAETASEQGAANDSSSDPRTYDKFSSRP